MLKYSCYRGGHVFLAPMNIRMRYPRDPIITDIIMKAYDHNLHVQHMKFIYYYLICHKDRVAPKDMGASQTFVHKVTQNTGACPRTSQRGFSLEK